ncbi:LysR substrate-binding domain-containing protein [Gluconacetobacter sp. Hr-1-5]|uniref:LysR substrate-binding domain-containing protein n=1 Tax=Gluconacetobacter sp. Hr-1-5 TaxID=3395370 RepID=UPI003B517526
MFLRQLSYLVALDLHRHFSRAAAHCGVSQPALSAGIRQLESELGIAIIQRNHRFIGFTDDGLRALAWARQTLAALDGLRQDAAFAQTVTGGSLAIGVIPSALLTVPLLLESFRSAIPGLHQEILTLSATEMQTALLERRVQLGVTYLDQIESDSQFEVLPLYTEQYVLAAHGSAVLPPGDHCNWREAAQYPLCLFTSSFRCRQFVDDAFKREGVMPTIVMETDSLAVLHAELRGGRVCSILPSAALPHDVGPSGLTTRTLCSPGAAQVGVARLRLPMQSALMELVWGHARRLGEHDVLQLGLASE